MNIEELLKELQADDKLYKLSLLYLLVKKEEKNYLLELYKKGNDPDVCVAIKNAIYGDKETMQIIKGIIEGQTFGNGEIPSFKETSEIIKKQTPTVDSDDIKEFIKNNKR